MILNKALDKQLLRNVIGGGKSTRFAFLLALTLTTICACTEDVPSEATPETVYDTRTPADSTDRAATTGLTVRVDTTWAGDTVVYY